MSQSFGEQRDKLVQELHCTPAFAEGYLDGRMRRRHGLALSRNVKVGTDEYSAGIRTGYYVEVCSRSIQSKKQTSTTR